MRSPRMAPLLAVLLALLVVAGCGSPPPAKSAPVERLVTTATPAGQRTAIVRHAGSAPVGAPLVVVLHGGYSSGQQAAKSYGWDDLADREGLVIAYPDGVGRTWHVGPACCGQRHQQNVDDVGYLHQLVEQLVAADGVDRSRVYAVGIATGAMMAYAWACGRPGELAGIGVIAGALLADCPHPAPITLAAVHGTADRIVPIAGGPGPDSLAGMVSPPLERTVQLFRTADRCPPEPATRSDAGVVHQRTWACAAGRTVSVAVLDGGGHQWPKARGDEAGYHASATLDATGWLWGRLQVAQAS